MDDFPANYPSVSNGRKWNAAAEPQKNSWIRPRHPGLKLGVAGKRTKLILLGLHTQ